MDSGVADILGDPKVIAPPALVIFDLNTDQLIRRYTFPPSDSKPSTFFANVVSIGFETIQITPNQVSFSHCDTQLLWKQIEKFLMWLHSIKKFLFQIVDVPKHECGNAYAYVPVSVNVCVCE